MTSNQLETLNVNVGDEVYIFSHIYELSESYDKYGIRPFNIVEWETVKATIINIDSTYSLINNLLCPGVKVKVTEWFDTEDEKERTYKILSKNVYFLEKEQAKNYLIQTVIGDV